MPEAHSGVPAALQKGGTMTPRSLIIIAVASVVALGAWLVSSGGEDLSAPPKPRTATEDAK
jgi:hypothetical protein